MIAGRTLDLFAPVLMSLPQLVSPRAIPAPGTPLAEDGPFLAPAAHPDDPDRAVLVAVIDHAIPFAHPLLTTSAGLSRVAAIWLMDAGAQSRRPDIAFGQELRGPQIDALCRPGDPEAAYRALGLTGPGDMSMARHATHGAAVAALAAGHDPGGDAGRAHPVLAVSLPRAALTETSGSIAALFIQAAVIFVIARARALARQMSQRAGRRILPPLVVNLSLGITAGSDDGGALMTRLQDAISASTEPDLGQVHFVLPTGNHRQDCLRAHLAAGQRIGWTIPPADPTPNAVEIWGAPGECLPRLRIAAPQTVPVAVPLDRPGEGQLLDANGHRLARIVLQRRGGASGRGCLTVILPPTLPVDMAAPAAPAGLWQLHLDEAGPSGCDLFVHRDDRLSGLPGQGRQSRLHDPRHARQTEDGRWPLADDPATGSLIRRNGTASVYARGARQIRVGAACASPEGRVSAYTGLLPDGAPGDVTAPADASPARPGMLVPGVAPASRQRLSGTSLAAPQVTRWLAMALTDGAHIPDRQTLRAEYARRASTLPDLPWRDGFRHPDAAAPP
ncbi:S8 family serine peptidase [Paracoccus hibiscisoli]|uniref:S8 family serine peptidase n=1 Tax=Paracoccus hibiscisoli TaxID=2023261 RepID=UPI00391C9CFE